MNNYNGGETIPRNHYQNDQLVIRQSDGKRPHRTLAQPKHTLGNSHRRHAERRFANNKYLRQTDAPRKVKSRQHRQPDSQRFEREQYFNQVGFIMKRFYFRFRVMLMMLALGLSSVWFFEKISIFKNEEIKDATFVIIAPPQPKFIETFRACGFGYVQGYETKDGIELTEGHLGCEKKFKGKSFVKKDKVRVISKIKTKENTYFEIHDLNDGLCINAPSIELGLELEEFLKTNR